MKFLLVAATVNEVEPVIERFALTKTETGYSGEKFDLLIPGVGMVSTAYTLGSVLARTPYHFALNAGIAGSFTGHFSLGEVFNVSEDCFCELGAEDGESFISIEELGFGKSRIKPIETPFKLNLPLAAGVTVNTVHGNEKTIAALKNRINADVETMEGAAFFYACNRSNLPSAQIRAVSNYVEKRNRDSWKTDLAIANLNSFLIDFISKVL